MGTKRKMSVMLFVVLSSVLIGHSASAKRPKNIKTPFAILKYNLSQMGVDDENMFLLTLIPNDKLNSIQPMLAKDLKVKGEVELERNSSASDVLTKLLKAKYGRKSNEKNDFLSIQYSMNSKDFEDYLEKYPHSKYAEDAKARWVCCIENDMLEKAKNEKTRIAYEAFADYCNESPLCSYEGYEELSKEHRITTNAIKDWYSLTDRSLGNNPSIYKSYSDYILNYGGSSLFYNSAKDSLELNKDRYDWENACSDNTADSYRIYIKEHKDGRFVLKAKALAEEFELWEKAEKSCKYEDYCAYYSEYPDGIFVDKAISIIKQNEEPAWEVAKTKNDLKAYESFVSTYPSGYYASEAQNKISELRLAPYLKEAPSFDSMPTFGYYSHPGFSLVCLGNVDMSSAITVSLKGATGFSKKLNPGQKEWVRVKNGKYKVLVQASNTENWWGNVSFENRVYGNAWFTTTKAFGITTSNENSIYTNQIVKEIEAKAKEEEINTLQYILGGE